MAKTSLEEEGPRAVNACQSDSDGFGLSKEERVRHSSEYRRIMTKGARHNTRHFMIRALENRAGLTRLGIAVSRKVGKAFVRNRIKRMIREYFRLNKHRLPPGADLVFVAKPHARDLETSELRAELDNFFDKL